MDISQVKITAKKIMYKKKQNKKIMYMKIVIILRSFCDI